ncbi:MAG: ATP-dependent DNA helicase RecG [Gammaproteobacteria bacterium]|nr:ATP-dependent DNA helicase RecG [Gammaproteobacteria bacterium]MBL6999843.1 ATP-dependent DNA helicase RecG [Gammaproteobacteria bacterium]
MSDWSREDVATLNGVGPRLREKLLRLGIQNKQQMLFHLPLRYEDRTFITPLSALQSGHRVLIQAQILSASVSYRRQGQNRRIMQLSVSDDSGFLTLRFFNFSASQQQRLQSGNWIRGYGEVRLVQGRLEMVHPEYEIINPDSPPPLNPSLTPVYPVTEGLHQLGLRKLMQQLMTQLEQHKLAETLPPEWLKQQQLPAVDEALSILHNPRTSQDVRQIQAMTHPAQQRFIIEELAAHRISLLLRKQQLQGYPCPTIPPESRLQQKLLQQLGFELTLAQQRVIKEILQDFERNTPMMRLLQGDVGCGKTVVAALACLPVIAADYQCALMAPTEILAEQHVQNFTRWFKPLGINVLSLMGADKGKTRRQKEQMIASGEAQMIVGTHALFQASVEFHALGLIIIDEQHRFGVDQRQALQKKAGENQLPHQLIMTATPIPRTLAMSMYADLDYSQIDELPPGRTPVKTSIIAESKRAELISSVAAACHKGQQIYWVCTLIDESEALQCEAAELTFIKLQQQLPGIAIGLVHGRMKAAEKEHTIQAFKQCELQLLVATTVIEVGVDVPNASIMIIENPERLGLAQIHQLRGRVGRGSVESFCLLLVKSDLSRQAASRLEVIRSHQDGFVIAEKDLEIRGAGEVLGTRQTGEASFRIVDLVRDRRWFARAQQLAELLMQSGHAQQCQRLQDNWIGKKAQYSDVG